MEEKIPSIMIAAIKSGSGKTTLTCALLEALKTRGFQPHAFKCGPDYIDPMFHRKVLDLPSNNLDSFFCDEVQLRNIYAAGMKTGNIAVVEGVMGLYDGLGGIREEGSAYHIASVLRLPIILIIDAYGMGRSMIPHIAGFLQYDKEKLIAGVVLNRITERFYNSIAPVIEKELQISVYGFLPKEQKLVLESRHLGLKMPTEIDGLQEQVRAMAEIVEKHISLEGIIETAQKYAVPVRYEDVLFQDCIQVGNGSGAFKNDAAADRVIIDGKRRVKIGIARDEAFCFYYAENLWMLEQAGAELIWFSPLHDPELPKGLDAILLGGGYPELYAAQLERNSSMRMSIKNAIDNGMPSVAECGGFMYLHHELEDDQGNRYNMCGVLPGKCFYTGKLCRFGYLELQEKTNNFLPENERIKGHEFHYYDSENNGQDCIATKPLTNDEWNCAHDGDEHFWGFAHLYYPSKPEFVRRFIEKAYEYQKLKFDFKS